MGPDRPNFKSYSHITALQPVGTVPGPFRPTCGLPGQPAGQPAGKLAGQQAGQLLSSAAFVPGAGVGAFVPRGVLSHEVVVTCRVWESSWLFFCDPETW